MIFEEMFFYEMYGHPLYLQLKFKPRLNVRICEHARSQKFAMGGRLVWGLGEETPSLQNFAFFFCQIT